jgi:hypothetical protein
MLVEWCSEQGNGGQARALLAEMTSRGYAHAAHISSPEALARAYAAAGVVVDGGGGDLSNAARDAATAAANEQAAGGEIEEEVW